MFFEDFILIARFQEVDTPLYPKVETENPTIMPKKDSPTNVIHSDKINSQNSDVDEPKNIRQSSLPPDGGFQVSHGNATIHQSNINKKLCFL